MKRTIKCVIGCAVVLGAVIWAVAGLGHLFRPFETDMAANAITAFHELPENSLEVIAYGSSHTWRGLDTKEMYEKYGLAAYNYGCHWQHINTTALFLQDSLRTQSPKVVLIDTYRAHAPLVDTNMDGEIYYTRNITGLPQKRDYLRQCFGNHIERYLSYYIPFYAFHSNWGELAQWSFEDGTRAIDFHQTRGYLPTYGVTPVTIGNPAEFEQLPLEEEALEVLDTIVESCREKNAQVIFYTAPWQGVYHYGDAMAAYAEANGCAYLNLFELMDEAGINPAEDFSDTSHLNNIGSKKVADFLGKYIVENYDVTDFRTVLGNS